MKTYIISIICVSVIGSLISILSPDGESGGLSKHTKLIFGLCLIIVCLNPVKDAIIWIRDLDVTHIIPEDNYDKDELDSIFNDAYGQAEIDNLTNGIETILEENFDIDTSECKISVRLLKDSDGKNKLDKIFITLYGSAIWKDTGAIEDYLSRLLGCEIITVIG